MENRIGVTRGTKAMLALGAALGLVLGLLPSEPTRAASGDPTSAARALGEEFGRACEKGDVAAVVALYDDRASAIYPGQGQEAKGKLNISRIAAETCRPGIKGTLKDIEAYPLGDNTIATVGTWEFIQAGPDGKPVTSKIRTTEVLMKKDGKWRYLIDHASIGTPPPPEPVAAAKPSDASGGAAKEAPAKAEAAKPE